jgi:transposase
VGTYVRHLDRKGLDVDREILERLLGEGLSLEQIGKHFGRHPSTISYWIEKYGLAAVNRDKHLGKGGIERAPLEVMVEAGMTIAEIADELKVSKATVRYWLRRYGMRTRNRRGPRTPNDSSAAKAAGLLSVKFVCKHHGETDFVLEGRGYYRCKECRTDRISQHRRRLKAILAEEAGGRCCICGYDRYVGSLTFHHLDREEKRLALAAGGLTLSLERLREEARKCVLLCANCHGEVEAGITSVPATVLPP